MFYNKGHQVGESGAKFHDVGERWLKVPQKPLNAVHSLYVERERRLC